MITKPKSKLCCVLLLSDFWSYFSQVFSLFTVWHSLPHSCLLFFLTVSCCNIPVGRSFTEYFYKDLENFLPGFCILSSDAEVRDNGSLLKFLWDERGRCTGLYRLHTVNVLCSVYKPMCVTNSTLLSAVNKEGGLTFKASFHEIVSIF